MLTKTRNHDGEWILMHNDKVVGSVGYTEKTPTQKVFYGTAKVALADGTWKDIHHVCKIGHRNSISGVIEALEERMTLLDLADNTTKPREIPYLIASDEVNDANVEKVIEQFGIEPEGDKVQYVKNLLDNRSKGWNDLLLRINYGELKETPYTHHF